MYTPDLQGNLLKTNPSTLSIASATAADDRGAKRVNFIHGAEPHVMYAKTCGGDGSGAVEEREVQGPRPFNQTFGV